MQAAYHEVTDCNVGCYICCNLTRHFPGCSDRQLQDLAQCAQVRIARATVVRLPKINAGLADANLLGDFGNR